MVQLLRPMTEGELDTRNSFLGSIVKGAAIFAGIALLATPFRSKIAGFIARENTGGVTRVGQDLTRLFTGIKTEAGVVNSASKAIATAAGVGAAAGGTTYIGRQVGDAIAGRQEAQGPHTQRYLDELAQRQAELALLTPVAVPPYR